MLAMFQVIAAVAVHWAYLAPVPPVAPEVKQPAWCRGELDHFALAGMEAHGLAPSPEADPAVLLRRACLDLTGLPPTPEETDAFLAHPDYEPLVDRLLASPRFGERWASVWLDLARFADTQGYEKDNLRTIWAYRDWVIQAFNDDLPFDQFTIEQLAGDLLPDPTVDQLTATAFHRNTMTNTEGGTDDEEFRLKAVIDRVNTTCTTWLGLTAGCAQCHDHPTEPLKQRDFYRLMAFFNNTEDADQNDDRPLLTLVPIGEREPGGDASRETTVPILRERTSGEARETHVFHRGDWRQPGEPVGAGTPDFLPALPPGNQDRLALARWLISPENPLTARVTVNRFWARLFGSGLVETEEDFGSSGAAPANQPLLDALAFHFATDWHWSVKRLLREMVLSATYRQSSAGSYTSDPANHYLARGPRFRLPAETVRDQALAAAGLLSGKMFGQSVMPPQPEGVWQVVYNVQRWVVSRGENRYRRGLYTFWRRTSPYPSLALFDAPTRESCTAQRRLSDTPAAALAMLNDPVYVEAAAALAGRMQREGNDSEEARLRYGWKLLLCGQPSEHTLEILRGLLAQGGYPAVGSALLNLDAVLTKE